METYSRIGLLKCHGNLQSYWTTELPVHLRWALKYVGSGIRLTDVGLFEQSDWTETYSRIGLQGCQGNLQSYWPTEMPWELTVVLANSDAMGTYSRIELRRCHENLQSY